MKTTKEQLQILTFADAGWETKRKYKQAIDDVWFPHPQDVQFDFAHYHYRVVLPPLPEGYDLVPLGTEVKGGSQVILVNAGGGCMWTERQTDYGYAHDKPSTIYAVKRQPTTKEVPLAKEVPLTAGDLPKGPGLWAELDGIIYQIMKITPEGVGTNFGSFWRFIYIQNKRGRFSVDRETWVNGWKEVQGE